MTHVSIYAQTRPLGSAAFVRKNNEFPETRRSPTDHREVIFEFFLIALAKFVQIGNRKTITTIRLFEKFVVLSDESGEPSDAV